MNNKDPLWDPHKSQTSAQATRKGGDEDSWMMSYGDMMTLLLVFFVLIVSISEIDAVKLQMVTQSMRNAISGEEAKVPTLKEIQQEVKQSVYDLNLEEVVEVERNKNGIQLMLKGESFFPSGSATLFKNTHYFLDEIVWQILKTPYLVSVEGHTDNIPIKTRMFPSNWELSAARAAAVVRYFESKGLPRNRFRCVGFADAQPKDPELGNRTAQARADNRRVVITFLNEFAEGAIGTSSEFQATE